MQDTCPPQNDLNCIKVKVCGCRRFRKSVLYGQCLFCSKMCIRDRLIRCCWIIATAGAFRISRSLNTVGFFMMDVYLESCLLYTSRCV